MPEIREVYEEERLEAILKALETAASVDEVRPLLSPPASKPDDPLGKPLS